MSARSEKLLVLLATPITALLVLGATQTIQAQPRPTPARGAVAGCPFISHTLNTGPGSRRSTDASRFYGECTLDQPVALEASVRQAKKLFFVEEGQVPQNDAQWQRLLSGQVPSVEMRYFPSNQPITRSSTEGATSPGPYFQVIDRRTSAARSLGGHRFAARTESGQNTEMFGLNYAFYQNASRDIARSYERLMADAQHNCLANIFLSGPGQTPEQRRLRQLIAQGCVFAVDTVAPGVGGLGAAHIFGRYARAQRELLFAPLELPTEQMSRTALGLRRAAQELGIAAGDRRTYLARIDELLTHPTFQQAEQAELHRRLTEQITASQSSTGWRNRMVDRISAWAARLQLWLEFSERTVVGETVAQNPVVAPSSVASSGGAARNVLTAGAEGAAAGAESTVRPTMRRLSDTLRYHNLVLALRARFLEYGASSHAAAGWRRWMPGFVTLMGAVMITTGVASVLGRGNFSELPWVGQLFSGNNDGDVDVFPGLARRFYQREFVDRYYLNEYFKIAQSVLDLSGRNGCLGGPVELATTDESMMLDQMRLLEEPELDLSNEPSAQTSARTPRPLTSARSHETITRFVAAGGNCAATSRVSAQVYHCNEAANACVLVRNYRHALADIVRLFQNYFAAYVENPSTLRLRADHIPISRQP